MGEENEILLKLVLDEEKTQERIQAIRKEMDLLKDEEKELREELKKGEISREQYNQALERNKQQNAALTKELGQQRKAIEDNNRANKAAKGSIDELKASASLLTSAWNALSKAEREDEEVGGVLQKRLSEVNEELKATGASVGDNRRNVGNYIKDVTIMGVRIGDVSEKLEYGKGAWEATSSVVKKAGFSLKALSAIPIILFLTGLVAFLKSTDEGADKLEQTVNFLTEAFDSLAKGIAPLGKLLVDLFTHPIDTVQKLVKGTDEYTVSLDKVVGAAIRAGLAQAEYTKTMQDVEDAENALIVQRAKVGLQVDQALLKTKDRSLSEKEKIDILRAAGKAEAELATATQKNAKDSFDAIVKLNKERARTRVLTDDEVVDQMKAEAALVEAQRDSLNTQQAIRNRETAQIEQAEAARKESASKALEAQKKNAQARLDLAEIELIAAKRNGKETLSIQEDIIRKQAAVQSIGLAKDSAARKLIEAKTLSDISDLRVKSALETANRLALIKQDEIKSLLTVVKAGTITELELNKALLNAEAEDQKATILATVKNKAEADAKIRLIDAETKKKLLEADRAFLQQQIQINNERAANDKKVADDLLARFNKDQEKRDENTEKTKAKREKAYEERKKKEQDTFDAISAGAEATVNISTQIIESINQKLFDALDDQQNLALKSAGTNADLREKIEADFAKKRLALEKEQAEERRKIALVEAVINGAKAVIEAAPNVALQIIAGATALAEIAVIKSQKFADGGYADYYSSYQSDGQGAYLKNGPGSGRSDSIPARLSVKESVINANSTEKYYDLLSSINVAGGGRKFPGANDTDIPQQYAFSYGGVANMGGADMNSLARTFAEQVNKVKPVLVIGDLNELTNDRNRVESRVTIG